MDRRLTIAAFFAAASALLLVAVTLLYNSGGRPPAASAGGTEPDFSIAVPVAACETEGSTTECNVAEGEPFVVDFKVNSIGTAPGYFGWEGYLIYTGVTFDGVIDYTPWPPCVIDLFSQEAPGEIQFGCVVDLFEPMSTYTGVVAHISFTCNNTVGNTISIKHGNPFTDIVDDGLNVYTEQASGLETLTVHCYPDPTPTPTPSPTPNAPVISLDVTTGDCGLTTGETSCTITVGVTETVATVLDDINLSDGDADTVAGYLGFQARLDALGLTIHDRPLVSEVVWPDCYPAFAADALQGTGYIAGCAVNIGASESTYVGAILEIDVSCTQPGPFLITLIPGTPNDTALANDQATLISIFQGDSLTIDCVPADTDGDGCTDSREGGMNPLTGGLRNPTFFWDYGDMPDASNARDRLIRVDDILRVVLRYFLDDNGGSAPVNRNSDPLSAPSATGYHPAFDRGAQTGLHAWDVAPPDGQILVNDILFVVKQYFHDCV